MPLKSWIPYSPDCEFPLENLPYGAFKRVLTSVQGQAVNAHLGVAIGDQILDLTVLAQNGFFKDIKEIEESKCFLQETYNVYMGLGRSVWKQVRALLQKVLAEDCSTLRDDQNLRSQALIPQSQAQMVLPATIGDYTDFYSSKEHASNVGTMFRGKENALMENWLHLPVGYHGRASSVVIDNTPVVHPSGQQKPPDAPNPVFGPSKVVDYELEMAFFVGPGNKLGEPIGMKNAEDHIFGMVVMNDWSARDIQKWEYVPLGPFGAKNWATTISPWIVTLEALEPFRVAGPSQESPKPLAYLQDASPAAYDIQLQVTIQPENASKATVTCNSNFKYLYWSMKQQLVHHSITGCNMRPGDLLASGTISGEKPEEFGSLLEKTWGGKNSWKLEDSGEDRTYIRDGDTVAMTGHCQGQGFRIGFGAARGKVLPPVNLNLN